MLPISYGDARPLLEALGGPVAPEKWRGALPLTYHLGPGPATVHLTVAFDFSQKPIYNVIATLTGRERPAQWVIRGNHHDAWVNGAEDPTSGMVAVLATPLPRLVPEPDEARRAVADRLGDRVAGEPELVWRPCRESTSPWQPFYRVPLEAGRQAAALGDADRRR